MTWKEVSLTPDNVIRCPVCGNIAYFKIDDGVKIDWLIFHVQPEVLQELFSKFFQNWSFSLTFQKHFFNAVKIAY